MDSKKTLLIVGVVSVALCVLVGGGLLILLGGTALLSDKATRQPVAVSAPIGETTVTEETARAAVTPLGSAAIKGSPIPSRTAADTTLSSFQPDDATSTCHWKRIDPVGGTHEEIAVIDGNCNGAQVSWSADETKAVLWLDPLEDGWKGADTASGAPAGVAAERLWLVTFAKGTFEPLPAPEEVLVETGIDAEGNVLAFTVGSISDADQQRGFAEYRGEQYRVEKDELEPILAHAFRLEKGGWTALETKATVDRVDVSTGVRALSAHAKLGPQSADMLTGQPVTAPVDDPKDLAKLTALGGGDDAADETDDPAGVWRVMHADPAGPALYLWEEQADGLFATGLMAFKNGEKFSRLEKLELQSGDATCPMMRGRFLLVVGQDGEQPFLYDVTARKLLWNDADATGTVLWPRQ